MMEAQTAAHLRLAVRNREFARQLAADDANVMNGRSTVVAFYAAVHYVNAYLWEKVRTEPQDHKQRTGYVRDTPVLKRCLFAYRRLSRVA